MHPHPISREYKEIIFGIICGNDDSGKDTLSELLQLNTPFFDQKTQKCPQDPSFISGSLFFEETNAPKWKRVSSNIDGINVLPLSIQLMLAVIPTGNQATKDLVCLASSAQLAIITIDICKGMDAQTRHLIFLIHLLGVKRVIFAINKMDMVKYDGQIFRALSQTVLEFVKKCSFTDICCIPICILGSENIALKSKNTPWYEGRTLLEQLNYLQLEVVDCQEQLLRVPAKKFDDLDNAKSYWRGTVTSGTIKTGELLSIQPGEINAKVMRLICNAEDLTTAFKGDEITIELEDQKLAISQGVIIAPANSPAEVADQFEVTVIWISSEPLLSGRQYTLEMGNQSVNASITNIKYLLNSSSLEHLAAKLIPMDGIARCNLSTEKPIAFDPFEKSRTTGRFVLRDRFTNQLSGMGIIHFALSRSLNLHLQQLTINQVARASIKNQTPKVLWFTGLSGSGKSTIANLVEKKLHLDGKHTYLLDGDNIRHGLNRDLGFTNEDRVENIRRIGEVAKLMADAGLIVLCAFISPFRSERQMVRDLFKPGEFIEIFVNTPLEIAEKRDPKGLYKKARLGQIKNFTGISSPYEPPVNPELTLDTALMSESTLAEQIFLHLAKSKSISNSDPSDLIQSI